MLIKERNVNRTFNLPSTSDYTFRGTTQLGDLGGKTNGKLPNIKGSFELIGPNPNGTHAITYTNPFIKTAYAQGTSGGIDGGGLWGGGWGTRTVGFDASTVSGIYVDNAGLVRPRSILMRFMIKY